MDRRPTPKESKTLRYFMINQIEDPANFPGVGKVTWANMVAQGWVKWVSSPETNEEGYMITEAGITASGEMPQSQRRNAILPMLKPRLKPMKPRL